MFELIARMGFLEKVDSIKRAMKGLDLKLRVSRGAELIADRLLSMKPRIGDEQCEDSVPSAGDSLSPSLLRKEFSDKSS